MSNIEFAKQIIMYSEPNDKTRCTVRRDVDIFALASAYMQEHEELDALKEKYRWRDAEKEPAPKLADDRTRFVLVHERQYETMTTAQYFYEDKTWYDFGGESVDVDYWRPLDLPEEESK